jgi:hypothetical protein
MALRYNGQEFKLRVSPYNSDVEEDFVKFCKKHEIPYTASVVGSHTKSYVVTIGPHYKDDTEREIIRHCERKNIPFQFYRDEDGFHHYNFPEMIEMGRSYTGLGIEVVDYDDYFADLKLDDIVTKRREEFRYERVEEPRKWWQKLFGLGTVSHYSRKIKHTPESLGYDDKKDLDNLAFDPRPPKKKKPRNYPDGGECKKR